MQTVEGFEYGKWDEKPSEIDAIEESLSSTEQFSEIISDPRKDPLRSRKRAEVWRRGSHLVSGRIADGVTECPFTSLITATVLCQRGFQEFALQSRKFNASIRPCQGVCSHLKRILRCQ